MSDPVPDRTQGTTTRSTRPAERYGDTPGPARRVAATVAVAAVAVAALAFLLWAAVHHATPDVRAALLGYEDVTDRSVTIRFEVVKAEGATVRCRVRAQNAANVTVGSAEVEVGPPDHGARSVVEVALPTSERPVNGELRGCVTV